MRSSNSAGQATHAPLAGQARARRVACPRRLRQSAPGHHCVRWVRTGTEGWIDDAHLVSGLQTSDLINAGSRHYLISARLTWPTWKLRALVVNLENTSPGNSTYS